MTKQGLSAGNDVPPPNNIAQPSKISNGSKPSADEASATLILLAEDNEDVAVATLSFLKSSGYRVLHATDGEMAVKLAVEQSPDLILMDVKMPGVDGLEAIARLRKRDDTHQTPIIAVTGMSSDADTQRCIAAGASECFCKPYRMGELVETIQKILDQRASV
jgi:CheY-like chemotaxis protein